MEKNVLVPLDGSTYSLHILAEIEKLLQAVDTQLLFVSVLETTYHPADTSMLLPARQPTPVYSEALVLKEEEICQSIAADLEEKAAHFRNLGFKVKVIVRPGNPTEEILAIIAEERVNLVALTTHAREGISRFIFNSVAHNILHQVNIPLLILHPAT